MHEFKGPTICPADPVTHPNCVIPAAAVLHMTGGGEGEKPGGTGREKARRETDPAGEPREKTITEAFDELDEDDQQTVNQLLDRMIGRKQ